MIAARLAKRSLLLAPLLVLAAVAWKFTVAREPNEAAQPSGPEKLVATADLGGEVRMLTYLSTDKPIYRENETVYFRGVLLDHRTRKPLPEGQIAQAVVEIKGPKGETVFSGMTASEASVLGFPWAIPSGQAGGEYTVKVSYPWHGFAPAEHKFDIRAYRAPRLKNQIEFLRDGYGPGDEVVATLHSERAEGGVPAGASVDVIARVDGVEAFRGQAQIDEAGDCTARFTLPAAIARGEGTLALVIEDGGVVETASKTIPILLQTVDLTMYPEGGQLVAGLPNRVYFEAFTPAQKPADLAGAIVDGQGEQVAEFRSEHEGRGRFAFTPEAGQKYSMRIDEPAGIAALYPLPEVAEKGAVLSTERDAFAADEPVNVQVRAAGLDGDLLVTLSKRESVIGRMNVEAVDGSVDKVAKFELAESDADGVLIATVWDSQGNPLAERLVFRQPAKQVRVKISSDAEQYVPGGTARLTIETTDESGKPLSAVVGLAVTDDSVLEMIEKREQAPRLPVMVLLEGDVRELADAHVYLDAENDEAPRQVDLLLGTQGWRRFAFINTEAFVQEHGDDARRVLALQVVTMREWSRSASMFSGGIGGGIAVDRFAAPVDAPGAPVAANESAPVAQLAASNLKSAPEEAAEAPQSAAALAPAAEQPARDQSAAGQDGQAAPDLANEPVNAEEAKRQQAFRQPQAAGEPNGELRARARGFAEKLDAAADRELALFERDEAATVAEMLTPVRLYAHQVRSDRQPGQRVDFTETLFWHAGLKTDDEGRASVEFGLNDSVTSFRVFADAFTAEGSLGSASTTIESVEPFYIEPKMPLEVTMNDIVRVPLSAVNATSDRLANVGIEVLAQGTQPSASAFTPFDLQANERLRRLFTIRVGKFNGKAELTVAAKAGSYSDTVTRGMMVRPLGFPIEDGFGGLIDADSTVSHDLTIPADMVKDSLTTRIVVYPTPLASMTEALERLIQEPNGCFEQTSSTVYPLVMAQQYFMSHEGVEASLIERSAKILDKGYERLIGFESPSGGFEWFGADPGHDALTAYGLMEFTDMSQVRYVDPNLLERTSKWLLAQRDGKGGFERKTHTYHCWLPEPELSYTYNTWSLLESGIDADLSKEVAWVRDTAEKSQNTYVVALAANVLGLAGDEEGANHLLDKLAGKQTPDGSLKDATQSVVGSGGEALTIETTSLAVMAWLKNSRYTSNVEQSIQYLAESCKAGRFGSTQSTILALQAIVAYDQSRATPKAPGTLQLIVDGKPVGDPVAFTDQTRGAIELPECDELLQPGDHQIQFRMTGGSSMPYSVAVNYHRTTPDTSTDCPLHLEMALNDRQVDEGAITEAAVTVVNRTGKQLPNPIAIIGVPGGLEPRHDQLKELVKQERIAAYEIRGREVILYWRTLDAEQRVDLPISLVAAIPGTYTAPASRAYLYYTDEHKHWVAGETVEILPRD